jgi:prepilin-type N-terminal cleavage/methylation domain-containing protein
MPSRRAAPDAFTLVELLVVIAIISVLAAMLMPALEQAVSTARHAACINNLKQHGIAHNLYANDFDGAYPAFGGEAAWDGTTFRTETDAAGTPVSFQFSRRQDASASAARVYFPEYLSVPLDADARERRAIAYCPSYDWHDYAAPTYMCNNHVSRVNNHLLKGGSVGYCFNTGRKNFVDNTQHWWYWARVDTRRKRRDPGEILVTDVLFRNRHWNWCGMSDPAKQRVWFNPHAGPRNTALPLGGAHQAVASGAVVSFDFGEAATNAHRVATWAAGQHFQYAYAERAGPDPSFADGPYYVTR